MNTTVLKQILILITICFFMVLILRHFVNVQPTNSDDITADFKMLVVDTNEADTVINQSINEVLQNDRTNILFEPVTTSGFYDTSKTIILKSSFKLAISENNLIEIPDTALAYIDFWTISDNKVKHTKSGMRVAVADREFFDNSNIVKLPTGKEDTTILISIKTDGPLELKLFKWKVNDWLENQSKEKILYGLFFGVMLILIVYNFLHAIYLRTHSYYYYCLYLLSQTAIIFTNSGLTKLLFWPDTGYLDTQIMYIAMATSTWFGLGFCISFLKIKQYSVSIYYFGTIIILATIITCILNFLGVYSALMMQIYYTVNFISLIYYLIVPLYVFNKGREYAKYLFYGFGVFSVTLAFTILKTIGWIENNAPTQEILAVGILLESLFLSIALYERIRNMKTRQEFAEKKLRITNANFVKTLLSNQEKDRTEISAFLHDAIGHDALILKQHINSLKDKKEDILIHLKNLIDKVRNLSIHIHPHVLSNLGLTAAIKQLVKNALKYTEIEASLDLNIDESKLTNNISISIYRIIQEALNNIIKYANSSEVYIQLLDKCDSIYGEIKDDGIGIIDLNVINSGSGLTIMKGRIKVLGGTIKIISSLNQGTKIQFNIPYNIFEESYENTNY